MRPGVELRFSLADARTILRPSLGAWSSLPLRQSASFTVAAVLSGIFVVISWPYLDILTFEYDEGPFILGARFVARGLRPFVDFAVHQPPLHLYLLALSGKLFGSTLFGYRMLSALSVALSGFLVF